MDQRIILQIRLSRRWVEGSPHSVEALAHYLYSLYSFLGLADPSAFFGWAIAQDNQSGAPYLVLVENPLKPDAERKAPMPRKVAVVEDPVKEMPKTESLSEDELDPEL